MLRNWLEYAAFSALCAVARWLPLAWLHGIASLGARLQLRFAGKSQGYALENLRIVFPDLDEDAHRQIALESARHFAWNAIDFPRVERWSREELARHVTIEGLEHLRRGLEAGRGVLLLTLHMGNFELAVRALNAVQPIAVVGNPMRNPLLYRRIRASRTQFEGELIDRDNAARRMLRVLRGGGAIGVLNDQYMRPPIGIFVPFFGIRAATSPGVATLALRTGARVCPVVARRDGPDHHVVEIRAPLSFEPSGEPKRDIERATEQQNRALEEIIREYPEQWMWGHGRFRHSPDLPA
jgi:KDO2-lipid IV(A) lauroyltransferase